jgi:hypothetical protein
MSMVGFRLHNIQLAYNLGNEACVCFLKFDLIASIIDCSVHADESFMLHGMYKRLNSISFVILWAVFFINTNCFIMQELFSLLQQFARLWLACVTQVSLKQVILFSCS